MLKRHYLDTLNIEDLASLYSVHRATAARWLAKLRETLLVQTQEHLTKSLALNPDELTEVISDLMSRFEVRLSRLLAPPKSR